MTPRRKLRQSLLLCVFAVALGTYDRDAESEPEVTIQPVEEQVAPGGPGPGALDPASDQLDPQAEEIFAF